jgi:hypothetical protein
MDLLQIRDEIDQVMDFKKRRKCQKPNENDQSKARQYFSNCYNEFIIKLKETDDIAKLIDIIERDKETYSMPVELMFLVYQRLIELQSNKNHLLDFSIYLWNVGGPDWKEELEAIEKLAKEGKIPEAAEVALKVDYYKYPIHEFK